MLFSLPLTLSLSPMTLLPCTLPKQGMFRKAVLTGYCSWGFVVDPNKTRDRPPYTYSLGTPLVTVLKKHLTPPTRV